jgi:glycyl-tRNA synthetase beta chain
LIAVALGNVRADVERIRAAKAAAAGSGAPTSKPANASAPAASATVSAGDGAVQVGSGATSNTSAPAQKGPAAARASSAPPTDDQVYDFIMERLRAYYLERAPAPGATATFTTEMFDAVLATKPASPLDFDARLKALRAFLDLPEATALAAANKRIANILRKSGESSEGSVDVEALKDPAESALWGAMELLRSRVATEVAQREYANALGRLAQLRPPVDAFFEKVMVMDEDPRLRKNRLALLAQLHGLFIGIADLSRLPG